MADYNVHIIGDCDGINAGFIEIFPLTGQPPYTIDWYNPNLGVDTLIYAGGSSFRFDLSGGTYQLLITDSSTIPVNTYVNLWVSTGVCASIHSTVDTTCNENNGEITFSAVTVNYPATYNLYRLEGLVDIFVASGSANNIQTFTSLPPGVYYAEITDGGGCAATTPTCIIRASTELDFGFYIKGNSPCVGENNGAIYITGCSGTYPYIYNWRNGATTKNITGLTAGAYSVTVYDSAGCSLSKTAIVEDVDNLGIVNFVNTSPSCFGADGQVIVNISGGTPPYYYQFSNGLNVVDANPFYVFNGLAAGAYTVIVTDSTLCVVSGGTSILNPNAFTSVSILISNSSCSNDDGSILMTGFGGINPYIFRLKDSDGNLLQTKTGYPSAVFTGLASGIYIVSMTTQNGSCTYSETVTVNNTQSFGVELDTYSTACNENNGSVIIYVDTPGIYTYQVGGQIIANTTMTAATFTNLAPGYYVAYVSDANPENKPCVIETPFIIEASEEVSFALATTSCGFGSGGTITALITSGAPPFTFGWSPNVNGQTGIYITGLTADTYSLILTDSNGCSAHKSVSITCPANYVTYSVFNVCNSDFDTTNGTKLGISEMFYQGYLSLISGETGCTLTEATFTILVDVGGTGYTSEFYTTTSLSQYPTEEEYANALRNLFLTIPGIGSIIINLLSNTLQISTDCAKTLAEENVSIQLLIDYQICCYEDLTPTPTPQPTAWPTLPPMPTPTIEPPTPTPTEVTVTPWPTRTPTPTPTPSLCDVVISFSRLSMCAKSVGTIMVDGVPVFSWNNGTTTTTVTINVSLGQLIEISGSAIPPNTCGYEFSVLDLEVVSNGTTIHTETVDSSCCSIDYHYYLDTCDRNTIYLTVWGYGN